MAKYPINNRDDAWDFCNRLMAKTKDEGFEPMIIEANFGKKRSANQNAYYWDTILTKHCLPFFKANPFELIKFIMNKALKFELTKEFVHDIFKMAYLGGGSTQDNDTVTQEKFHLAIREEFLHEYKILIPEPNKGDL